MQSLKQDFYKRLFMYPHDALYVMALAKNLGLKKGEEWRLYSVMGAQELSDIFQTVQAEDFSSDFRVNLHLHTQHSDGVLSVEEVLNQAVHFAKMPRDLLPAFTVAISDHDTVDGIKEALHILIKNPEKYKNIRFVCACEIGALYEDKDLKYPFEFELIYYGLNPFDEGLNKLLNKYHKNRQQVIKQTIKKLKETFPKYKLFTPQHLQTANALVEKALGLGFSYHLMDLVKQKISDPQELEKAQNIAFSYRGKEPRTSPSAQEIFNCAKKSLYGFVGMAHPAKNNIYPVLKENFICQCSDDASRTFLWTMMYKLKELGMSAMELNYQYEHMDDGFKCWVAFFEKFGIRYKMLKLGGYDTHGPHINARVK